uniref:Signal recognition particle 19 kDa protein n=1 Tax=Cuerna arida TaxID=1464854 RepID=A0A1B6GPZ7_9HEMI
MNCQEVLKRFVGACENPSDSVKDFWDLGGEKKMALTTSGWTSNRKHSDPERWICIYPAYINSRKTTAEGRRIPKDKAVNNPTYQEIRDVLVAAGLKIGVEHKMYSRETSKEIHLRGRIRVQLKSEDGYLTNEKFPTRQSVMLHLGAMIPMLKSRSSKLGIGDSTLCSGKERSSKQGSSSAVAASSQILNKKESGVSGSNRSKTNRKKGKRH